MFLTPVRQKAPLNVSLDITDFESDDDDSILNYHSELIDETREKKRIRLTEIDMSSKLSRAKLRKSYQMKLIDLTTCQRKEIQDLSDQWREAHAQAELEDETSSRQNEESLRLFTLCGDRDAARQLSKATAVNTRVKACDSSYTRLMQRLLARHRTELDWLKTAFRDELELSREEHELMNRTIDNQFKIETAQNITEVVKYISSTDRSPLDKARLIKSVSPKKQRKSDVFCTPVTKRVRVVPNTK